MFAELLPAAVLHLTREFVIFAQILEGMLQDSRNDTMLKQLHQAVEIRFSGSIHVSRPLLETPEGLRVPPLSVTDTINREFIPVLKKQSSLEKLVLRAEAPEMVLIPPIRAEKVVWLTEEPVKPRIILPERKMEQGTPDWEMGIFIFTLILLGSVRLFFNRYLGQFLSATVSYMTASRMFRERSLSLAHASFRLDILFYMIFSLFIFHALPIFDIELHSVDILAYLFILGGVLLYFGLKKLVYTLQGSISRNVQETAEYLFNMNNYNRILGLFLLPVSLIVAFTPLAEPVWVIYGGIFFTVLFYILLILRGVKILLRKQFSIFYLILYLCTLEILPLLFICKLMLG